MSYKKERREITICDDARVYTCDRCGGESLIPYSKWAGDTPRNTMPAEWAWMDINVTKPESEKSDRHYLAQFCPDCITAIFSWFRTTRINLREWGFPTDAQSGEQDDD